MKGRIGMERDGSGRIEIRSLLSLLLLVSYFALPIPVRPCPPLSAPPASAADQKTATTGTLTQVSGTVEVMKRGAKDWVQATNGMKIGSGDQINTGIDGTVTLTFANTVSEIKPLTQFTLGRAMESDKEYTTEMFLAVGKLVTKADKNSGKTNKFSVTTPSAVAGIRGTTQEVGVDALFGTECKIEDGAGGMTPNDPATLPPAVQMCLGAGPVAEASAEAKSEGPKADAPGAPAEAGPKEAPGAGEAVSEAATATAGEGQATAEAVGQALDQWLEQSFDNQVVGEEGGAAEGAPGEAPAEGVEDFGALLDAAAAEGDLVVIEDGQEAAVADAVDIESVIEPTDVLLDDAITDITAAGTTDAEAEAALSTTEISDEPVSEQVFEESTSEEATFTLINEITGGADTSSGSTSQEEVDLFGQPPSKPN